jgi:hypothetical protein
MTMLDWTLSYGPITIGDAETLPAVNFTNFDIASTPDIRTNDIALIQRDGLWAGDDYLGGRTVNLSLEVQAMDTAEFSAAVNLIMQAFSPGVAGETPLRFRIPGIANGREAYVNARTRKRSNPLDASFARLSCAFEIELFATDPAIYAVDETNITLKPGVLARITVDGSRSVQPYFLIDQMTNPTLTNAITGEVITFPGSGTWTPSNTPTFEPGDTYMTLSKSGNHADAAGFLRWRDSWV